VKMTHNTINGPAPNLIFHIIQLMDRHQTSFFTEYGCQMIRKPDSVPVHIPWKIRLNLVQGEQAIS